MQLTIHHPETDYLQVTGNLPTDLSPGTFVSVNRNPPLKIYHLGFQPAKSIPEIPSWFLHKYATLPFTVLDPFAGSGTTLIESLKYGSTVYWLDYHPLSRLICRVKTMTFSTAEISAELAKIIKNSSASKKSPETVSFANKDFWFQKPVQEGLEILREHISASTETTQPLFWLAFATTVRKTANMNDGMILAARRSHIKDLPEYSRTDVFSYFQSYVNQALEAVTQWNQLAGRMLRQAQELPLQDARTLTGNWQVDAVVTSPPYINAIDYVWASKFELHWLGLVNSNKDRLSLYQREIGTERITRQEYQTLGKTGNSRLDQLIEDIYTAKKYQATPGQNPLRARVVYQYFMDMKSHFTSSFKRLREGGYYCFTVGDMSKICGVDIPVANLLTELASEIGFRPEFHFHLLLKNRRLNIPRNVQWAGTIKHDTTVVLRKPLG